jgi:hypothetical protein
MNINSFIEIIGLLAFTVLNGIFWISVWLYGTKRKWWR